MASKSKLKKHEIIFGNKCIDLKRFAYDVIVHQVLKFDIPKNCICTWKGSENDYGYPNFLQVVSRLILGYQIALRYSYYKFFNHHYESNKLESFKSVSYLLQTAFKRSTGNPLYDTIDKVETTLSVVCEMVLFLYSKNLNLYLTELCKLWFDCCLLLDKKIFEKEVGLDILYKKVNKVKFEHYDTFYDTFILVHCHSYEISAKNENLERVYIQSARRFIKKLSSTVSGKEYEHPPGIKLGIGFQVDVSLSSTSKESETFENDSLQNPGLGIVPHEQLLKDLSIMAPDATQSQNLPRANPEPSSPQESGNRRRGLSVRRKSKLKSSSNLEQSFRRLSLQSSGTKLSREEKKTESGTDDLAKSRNLPAASFQESERHQREFSGQQADNLIRSSDKQKFSFDSPGLK